METHARTTGLQWNQLAALKACLEAPKPLEFQRMQAIKATPPSVKSMFMPQGNGSLSHHEKALHSKEQQDYDKQQPGNLKNSAAFERMPNTAVVNCNVQTTKNSVLLRSSCIQEIPGVYLTTVGRRG